MDASEVNGLLQRGNPYPKPLQKRVDYNGTNDPVYYGWALYGYAETDPKWYVEKLEYDADGRYVKSTHSPAESVWADRATLTYS